MYNAQRLVPSSHAPVLINRPMLRLTFGRPLHFMPYTLCQGNTYLALLPLQKDSVLQKVVQIHVRLLACPRAQGRHADLAIDVEDRPRAAWRPERRLAERAAEAIISEVEAVEGTIEVVLRDNLHDQLDSKHMG